jgi:hypothetical protein
MSENKFKLKQHVIVNPHIYQFGGMKGVITDCPVKLKLTLEILSAGLKGYLVDLGFCTINLSDDDLTLDPLETREEKLNILLDINTNRK